ncbi:hypothetical protein BDV28DRAFT_148725 [Aspergillus coremiiformis]|uniref:Zn(2)-C6 fungal-type domain-containing protein n=1 Tax=Aspergillus coremiiformis TaxID=138285 RepID=A0A5N6Z5T7_9EURO|nr:hypothetical protein BDV28DRAFT_148725 [Aspergillus coremiiformis]
MSNSMQPQGVHKTGRRNRVPLSCDPCRVRKLKCNREKPCQNCIARDEKIKCKYKGSSVRAQPISHHEEPGDSMQQRIDHLEGLVKRLIAQHQGTPLANASRSQDSSKSGLSCVTADAPDTSDMAGVTLIDDVHSVYKGTEDWFDVLQEINNLKRVWSQTQDGQPDYSNIQPTLPNTVDGSSLLFGHVNSIDKLEILATLPPKPEIDRLIIRFFDRESFPIRLPRKLRQIFLSTDYKLTMVPAILHEPTFMREYTEHWRDPSRTNVIWLGLLFSILGITMLSYHQFGEPPEYDGISESLFQLYRLRTAQCLIQGDIAKCLPYTLETLRFNATAELNRKDDNSRGLWIMTGVIVRAAVNMGYHREPSSSISVLQAEYRRRVWYSVIGMDDVASFLAGFPRMLPAIYTDTKEPRNLHDWELSEDITILPTSRPPTESTPVSYLIVKGRLFRALGRVTDLRNNPSQGTYDTVVDIDKHLYEAYQGIPQHMKIYGRPEQFSNLQLVSMYHYGMCILHRKYIAKARLDPRYNISRDRCISSALALLDCQQFLKPAWYKSSQIRKMSNLAAMLLFLDLEHGRRDCNSNTCSNSGDLLQALEKSCALWGKAKGTCNEAQNIYQILTSMLSSFQNVSETSSSRTQSPGSLFEFAGLSPQFQPFPDSLSGENALFATSNDMDIDWVAWDALIERASFQAQTEKVDG